MNIESYLARFYTSFPSDPESALERGREIGLNNRMTSEIAAWCWEVNEQIRALARELGLRTILMGGTGAQLRFQVGHQRGSRDNDYLTDASETEIEALMRGFAERFADAPEPFFRPDRKPAPQDALPLPIVSYDVPLPSLLGHTDAGGVAKVVIKADFHFVDRLPPFETVKGSVFPIKEEVEQEVPVREHQVALKLTTLLAEPIGIPAARLRDIPKQVHDIDALLTELTTHEQWSALWPALVEHAATEAPYAGVKTPTEEELTDQLSAALALWAEADTDEHLWQLIENYQGAQVGSPGRRSKSEWRARARRLHYALLCARVGAAGADAWAVALAFESTLGKDQKTERAAIAQRWRDERGTSPPGVFNGRPSKLLWWEYLGTRTEPASSPPLPKASPPA